MKKRISDVLAWLGFVAGLLCLSSFVVPLADLAGVVTQVVDTYEEVSDCASQRCEAQLRIEDLPQHQGLLGTLQGLLSEWRYELFLMWLGIGMFQTFFIRSFRLLPWRPVVIRLVTRVPLEELDK